jgi:hypothetical protein
LELLLPDPGSPLRTRCPAALASRLFRNTEVAEFDYVLAWSARHRSGAQPAKAGNNQAMDVGAKETTQPHSLAENFSKIVKAVAVAVASSALSPRCPWPA